MLQRSEAGATIRFQKKARLCAEYDSRKINVPFQRSAPLIEAYVKRTVINISLLAGQYIENKKSQPSVAGISSLPNGMGLSFNLRPW